MPLGKTRSKRQRGSGASIPTLNDANLGEQLRNAIRTESITNWRTAGTSKN
uniref:Uncharacterized protein n=1 Tax=viral metagenome TaxID=1070528 RepID=A0A6C0BW59_9ZZZZ